MHPNQAGVSDAEYERRYELYGKPLEVQHQGKYLAIAQDGRTLVADSLRDAAERAKAAFGPGSFLYKIGEPSVGTAYPSWKSRRGR
jgi:hypothetical protein